MARDCGSVTLVKLERDCLQKPIEVFKGVTVGPQHDFNDDFARMIRVKVEPGSNGVDAVLEQLTDEHFRPAVQVVGQQVD